MNAWDDIITSRGFFLDKIWEKLCSSPANSMEVDGAEQDSTAEELGALVKDCKFNMKLNMADSAWKQNNFSVATKLLKELHREAKAEKGWLQRWVHSFSRFSQRRSQSQGPAEQISSLLKTVPLLEEFEEQSEASTSKVFRDQRILLGTTFDLLASAVHRSPSALEIVGEERAQRILELSRAPSSDQVKEECRLLNAPPIPSKSSKQTTLSSSSVPVPYPPTKPRQPDTRSPSPTLSYCSSEEERVRP
ncbi:DNA-dependent protein kinase catalytic subunit-like isoform X2 [Neoarius graeffei]|uniref:DNA-dependent protein kinase catalytic subunit-like isoform X2 n=1 Tax=Neoarius graeffei TaxID=443677 RepID=UPI00298C40E3|nr:DNA-dependent protein kinase catalytic subunit-like isoform X2 [Neoarius graeffei]